jgi:hypothetical protein
MLEQPAEPFTTVNLSGKQKLQASAPKSFAPAGTPRSQMRLVVEDDRFHWELKRNKNANRKK